MRLITGPAGSGKTVHVLESFRHALRNGNQAIRLLTPTATLAQHLGNQIAREGFIFRPGLIQTLHGFVEGRVADFPQAPESVVYLLVEEAVTRVNRPEFRRVADLPGFCARLARTILEFSAAGCDSDRLAACIPDAPLAAAFLAVYQEVDRALDRRGLLLRAKRLACAAARIHANGIEDIQTIWLAGFHALPDPELAVIQALGAHADLTLTLTDSPANGALRARLIADGFQEERFERKRGLPAMALVKAPRIEREVEEIARRILEQAAAGRPFREMGIIVRAEEAYTPLFEATLERFGIPAHSYFEGRAAQHPVTRFLTGAVDAMLGGWDHRATLAVLRLAPRFGDSSALDHLDFKVREQIPNQGLGSLRALLPDPEAALGHLIDALASLEELRSFELSPADWAARLLSLCELYRLPHVKEARLEMAPVWRSHAAALQVFGEALTETAQALEPARLLELGEFWRAAKSVLRRKPLRVPDGRRNVVHVMSAYEARQWALPVVFVCGMVEKQFPRVPVPDLFFPDAARQRLHAAGIRVRTAAEIEEEEHALYESACSRASMLVTLSYPEFTSRGDRNLPSMLLDPRLPPEDARVVRPAARHILAPAPPPVVSVPQLDSLSVSALESWLQCPFRYFGTQLLRLRTAPLRPEQRLDYSVQGKIVHAVLERWHAAPQNIAALFEEVFAAVCEDQHIPQGYHTERLRNDMLEDLERFADDSQWRRADFRSRTEEKFVFPLNESLKISGRIDRLDEGEQNQAYVIDYKYSTVEQVKKKRNGNQLQGPLYVLAAQSLFQVRPVGMFFVALKGGVDYVGWSESGLLASEPIPPDWGQAAERAAAIAAEIRRGRIAPGPSDKKICGYCDARDVCRFEVRQASGLSIAAEQP